MLLPDTLLWAFNQPQWKFTIKTEHIIYIATFCFLLLFYCWSYSILWITFVSVLNKLPPVCKYKKKYLCIDLNQREWALTWKKVWKINLAQSSEQPLRILFCLPDLWMSTVSLCDPSSSGWWTGGDYWWAWRALSTPYSPAADQRERQREIERAGGVNGRQKRSENRKKLEEKWKM